MNNWCFPRLFASDWEIDEFVLLRLYRLPCVDSTGNPGNKRPNGDRPRCRRRYGWGRKGKRAREDKLHKSTIYNSNHWNSVGPKMVIRKIWTTKTTIAHAHTQSEQSLIVRFSHLHMIPLHFMYIWIICEPESIIHSQTWNLCCVDLNRRVWLTSLMNSIAEPRIFGAALKTIVSNAIADAG